MSTDAEVTGPQGKGHWEVQKVSAWSQWFRITYGPNGERVAEVWVPKPELPTEPGIYYDKYGDVWTYQNNIWRANGVSNSWIAMSPEKYMPFEFIAPLKKGE